MGRHLRSHLDLLHPEVSARVQRKQEQQKVTHDQHARARSFAEGETVFVKDFPTWLPGTILKAQGPLSYHATLKDGQVVRLKVVQVKAFIQLTGQLLDACQYHTVLPLTLCSITKAKQERVEYFSPDSVVVTPSTASRRLRTLFAIAHSTSLRSKDACCCSGIESSRKSRIGCLSRNQSLQHVKRAVPPCCDFLDYMPSWLEA